MEKVTKREWYETLISDMQTALEYEFYLEAIFIEYILIDDRLKSICKHTSISIGDHEMMGSILRKIKDYIEERPGGILVGCLNNAVLMENIGKWKDERNTWMHNAGNDKLSYEDYKGEVKELALDGQKLAKELCNAVQRLRKQAEKI